MSLMQTPEEVREAAKNIIEQQRAEQNKNISIYESLLGSLNTIDKDSATFEDLTVLLSLPDDQFSLLYPVFIDTIYESVNNVNDKLLMVKALNTAGVTIEEMQDQYALICKDVDNNLNTLSQVKRDFLKQLLGITFNAVSDAEGVSKKTVFIPLEKCHENAKIPTYAHETDAGMDVYALEDITIAPGQTIVVPTGLKVAIPAGYELQVRPKSGRCVKTKLRISNTPGTIDAGYRDEIGIIIDNIDPPIKGIYADIMNPAPVIEYGSSYTIGKGEKFAQLVLSEVPKACFYEVESVGDIENDGRKGGFGSSGLK